MVVFFARAHQPQTVLLLKSKEIAEPKPSDVNFVNFVNMSRGKWVCDVAEKYR
jgi:hypothetical protein